MSKNVLGNHNRLPRTVALATAVSSVALLAACSPGKGEAEAREAPRPTAAASHEAPAPSSQESRESFERGMRLTAEAGRVVLDGVVADINGDELEKRNQAPVRNTFAVTVGANSVIRLSVSPALGPAISFARVSPTDVETWTGYSLTSEQYDDVKADFAGDVTPAIARDLAQDFEDEVPAYVGARIPGNSEANEEGARVIFPTTYAVAHPKLEGDAVSMFSSSVELTPGEFEGHARQVRDAVSAAGGQNN